MIKYVLGLCYSNDYEHVCVIKKNRGPVGMAGNWNAPGGKVEYGETAHEAMAREFAEETGLVSEADDWELVAYKTDKATFVVSIFRMVTDEVYECKTIEDEEIQVIPLCNLSQYQFFDHLDQTITAFSKENI